MTITDNIKKWAVAEWSDIPYGVRSWTTTFLSTFLSTAVGIYLDVVTISMNSGSIEMSMLIGAIVASLRSALKITATMEVKKLMESFKNRAANK